MEFKAFSEEVLSLFCPLEVQNGLFIISFIASMQNTAVIRLTVAQ